MECFVLVPSIQEMEMVPSSLILTALGLDMA